jgi:hypothetical protein
MNSALAEHLRIYEMSARAAVLPDEANTRVPKGNIEVTKKTFVTLGMPLRVF